MRVLHLLTSGGIGGIETLMRNYAGYSQHENVFLFVYSGGVIADEIAAMNKEVLYVPAELRGNAARLKWIMNRLKTLRLDVIVSHHSSPIFKLVLACSRVLLPGVKLVAYAHANAADIIAAHEKGASIRKLVHYIGFKSAHGIIAISGSVQKSLEHVLGINKKNVYVLYNAVSIPEVLPPVNAFSEKPEVVYVGRLIREKGVQTILSALAHDGLYKNMHLTVVGDGPYREQLEALAAELGVSQAVDFVGLQHDITPFLLKADIFVHAPEWEEGFGITVVEAMAYGLLCICTNNGALPELISDEENGFLVEAHSASALAQKLAWVKANAASQQSFETIRKNAQKAAGGFNAQKYARELDAYLMTR
ncbi:MAG: glycosyltransferase [Clostridia bacterium]|nr:glycosyltransferase [Clostridia bacterium]